MSYVLSIEAATQLDDIWVYLAERSGSLEVADRLIDSLTDRFELLARNPGMGRRRDELRIDYRSFPVGQYLILYRVLEESVEIMHVLHGKRDLGSLLPPK